MSWISPPAMMTGRKASLLWLVPLLVAAGCFSMVPPQAVRETPLYAYAPRIIEGQTTGREIRVQLGSPDVEATGASWKVSDNSVMDQWQTQGALTMNNKWMKRMPYSSLDDRHTALLYLELALNFNVRPIPGSTSTGESLRNKLLVIVDKETDRVLKASYHEEFRP